MNSRREDPNNPYEIVSKQYTTPEEMEGAAQRLEQLVAMARKFSSEGSSQYEFLRRANQLREKAAAMRVRAVLP